MAGMGRKRTLATARKSCPTGASACLASLEPILHQPKAAPLILPSNPRRPRRSGEWTQRNAVTFIVTLAATRSVTLAARAAGMSCKAAYALKSRDAAFAHAWKVATAANRAGDKAKEVGGTPVSPTQGNTPTPATRSIWSTARRDPQARKVDEALRDRFFARLLALQADSAAVAPRRPLP